MFQTADEQYFSILKDILENGDVKGDRTGTGTLATFGQMAKFDLSDGSFPVLTTKRVSWKTAIREMLWFLTGDTNIRPLLQQNVDIWTDWPLDKYNRLNPDKMTREKFKTAILEDEKFASVWGELGPVYGSIWRKWKSRYGHEIDQIAIIVDQLRNNPNSRRIILEGWKVDELDSMALPPCHKTYQYQVTTDGKLNSLLYCRSQDFMLGTPFNWVGQATLQIMLAHISGLTPGIMTWVGADTHLYSNHIDQVNLQLTREPRQTPKMKIINKRDSIDDFKIEDFVLEGYDPHPAISAPVAV